MFDEGQLFGMHKWAVITLWKSDKGCGSYSKSNMQFWATSSALIRVLNSNSDNSKLFCMNKWASLRIFIKIRRKLWELFYIFKIHDFGYSVARRSECSNFNSDNSCYSTCKIELLCQFLRKSKKNGEEINFFQKKPFWAHCVLDIRPDIYDFYKILKKLLPRNGM